MLNFKIKSLLYHIMLVYIIIILLIFVILCNKKTEYNTNMSSEAIQNISSLYNDNEINVTNLNVTGKVVSDLNLNDKKLNLSNGEVVVGGWYGSYGPQIQLNTSKSLNIMGGGGLYVQNQLTAHGVANIPGFKNSKNNNQMVHMPSQGWGVWNGWSTCPKNKYVCGLRTRTWNSSGPTDSGLMGLEMQCCSFN
jgi:Vitelline membrane outer layer protein I (VOMI)